MKSPMKMLARSALVVLTVSSLAGCVAYPVPYDSGPGYRRGPVQDRDGDGVRNRDDRRPNNPYRY